MEFRLRESSNAALRPACGLAAAAFLGFFSTGLFASEPAAEAPRITFTKVLRGSVPEYFSITVDANGEGTYDGRKLDAPPEPRPLKLKPATTRQIFNLVAALDYFNSLELESRRKVANLGQKTFVYEENGRRNEIQFNYTQRREAQQLTEFFERLSSVLQHLAALEHAIRFDHLSLPGELRQIEWDLNRNALAEPELLAPTLEQIAGNRRFLNLAQTRAQNLLARIQQSDSTSTDR
jgi:hypothetical protein